MVHNTMKIWNMIMLGDIIFSAMLMFATILTSDACNSYMLYQKPDDGYMTIQQTASFPKMETLYDCREWCQGRPGCHGFLNDESGCTSLSTSREYQPLTKPGLIYIPIWMVDVPEPDVYLSMDRLEDGVLQGTFLGTVTGGATLRGGRRGNALYTNGVDQWVDLGNHRDKCFGNLELCNDGYVISFWLKAPYGYDTGNRFYVSNGGNTQRSVGIAVRQNNNQLKVTCRTETQLWNIEGIDYSDDIWYHMTVTWDISGGLHVYFNGHPVAEIATPVSHTSNRNPDLTNFYLGVNNEKNGPGEMTLDELRMWDAAMDNEAVWNIFMSDAY